MSDLAYLLILAAITIMCYLCYLQYKLATASDSDDYETDGGDRTKIRHERGM
jgi:hypothetical protein